MSIILAQLLLISTIDANRLLEDPGLVPVPSDCASLTCLQGYSCCDDGAGAYCCMQSESIDICSLPKLVGSCEGAKNRYYFNSTEQACKPFVYGGCEGNKNNFKSLKSCAKRCVDSFNPSSTSYTIDPCTLSPERGPCRANMPRFYYDSDSDKCKIFFYGGCRGNKNRFNSKKECVRECGIKDTTQTPIETATEATIGTEDICTLPSESGRCKADFTRYYYNSETEQCEIFTYGGCGGNGNNFEALTECIATCDKFDWSQALMELNDRKALWEANKIWKYRYHFEHMCFCPSCHTAGKYIEVKNGTITKVVFDDDALSECDDDDLYEPIEDNYMDIDALFDRVINHVMEGMNASCDDASELDHICGGGIEIHYDEVLSYPTYISLEYGPLIADADGIYTMDCLTVIDIMNEDVLDLYENECCTQEVGEECLSNNECCYGICSTISLQCCYTAKHSDIVCESDDDCCDGFECDSSSQLCVLT